MTIDYVANHFASLTEDRSDRFDEMAGAVFAFQRRANRVYSRYCKSMPFGQASPDEIHPSVTPFLPVDAFKHAAVTAFDPDEAELVFMSSATGRGARSRHYVRYSSIYETAVSEGFDCSFGIDKWRLVAHLPEYAPESSLVYMVRHLMETRGAEGSGFVVDDTGFLDAAIDASRSDGVRLILFGAAFGLLDLVEERRFALPTGAVVLETGGMKTHRRAIARRDLHARLSEGFGVPRREVRSEYGMCELMSQCYTRGGKSFVPPPWMRCYVVDTTDPTQELPPGRPGMLAVVDLANLYSCSFLLTGDRAVRRHDGIEVLGRLSGAELRGCNFLLEYD